MLTLDSVKHSRPTPADDMALHTDKTSHWISSILDSVLLHSSSRLQVSISKLNAKFTVAWKEDFGPPNNSTVLFPL